MKNKNFTILPLAAALCVLATASVRADVFQTLTISITTYTQSAVADNGTNSTAAAPQVKTHKTPELLQAIAKDEFALGNWPSNGFPATAKLAVGNDGFAVINGTNVLITISSDILKFEGGDNEIFSGKRANATGLANPTIKSLQIGRLIFDDTAIQGGAGLKFWIGGFITNTETDTVPTAGGVYTQTISGKMTNGAGEGSDSDGNTFVLTGTVSVSGKGTQTLPQ